MKEWLPIVLCACRFEHGALGVVDAIDDTTVDTTVDATELCRDNGNPLRFEAELFAVNAFPVSTRWLPVAEPGVCGGVYMTAAPDAGVSCVTGDFATLTACAPRLEYPFTIATPGTYYFHARMMARVTANGSDNSLWFAIDTTAYTPYVNSDPPHDDLWHWWIYKDAGANPVGLTLLAGPHRLTIFMREDGASLDVMELSASATSPL